MKIISPLPTAICVAALILFGVPSSAPAKDKKTESATPEASATPATKAKAMPYRGTVASVDAIAKTFTVGKRTIKVTDQTKITKHGAAATMADITVGEKVGGSYWKNDDGVSGSEEHEDRCQDGRGKANDRRSCAYRFSLTNIPHRVVTRITDPGTGRHARNAIRRSREESVSDKFA